MPGIEYRIQNRNQDRDRLNAASIYEQIEQQKRENEAKDIKIEELRRRLAGRPNVLRIGTRPMDCPVCQKNHLLPDLPGEYDLCVHPRSHWKGGPIPLTVSIKEDGTVIPLAYGLPIDEDRP